MFNLFSSEIFNSCLVGESPPQIWANILPRRHSLREWQSEAHPDLKEQKMGICALVVSNLGLKCWVYPHFNNIASIFYFWNCWLHFLRASFSKRIVRCSTCSTCNSAKLIKTTSNIKNLRIYPRFEKELDHIKIFILDGDDESGSSQGIDAVDVEDRLLLAQRGHDPFHGRQIAALSVEEKQLKKK